MLTRPCWMDTVLCLLSVDGECVMSGPALGLCLNLFSLSGLALNLYILVIVLLTKQTEGGGGRLLLGHLGLTGTLLCLVTLLSGLPLPCTLTGLLFTLLHPLSLYTLCGLNCDRYAAIAAPLHYARLVKPRKVICGLTLAWLLSLLLALSPLAFSMTPTPGSGYTPELGLTVCTPELSGRGGLCWAAVYTALTLLLPLLVILICNLKVLMIARYHRHRIARAIFEVTLSAQVTITHQKNPFLVSSGGGGGRGRSPTTTVLQLVGSAVILYSPYYLLILWQGLGRKPSPGLISVASGLVACAPALNALLYGLKNKLLRRAFRHYWRKKMTKNELEQEIQARTPSRRPSLTPQKQVWRPVSTSALGLPSPNSSRLLGVGSFLRHSATSTSILASRGGGDPRGITGLLPGGQGGSGGLCPRITVTSDSSSGDGDERRRRRHQQQLVQQSPGQIRIIVGDDGGSESSMSADDSDLTTEEREWRWLGASSSSLPTATASTTFLPYFPRFDCMRSDSETGLIESVMIAL